MIVSVAALVACGAPVVRPTVPEPRAADPGTTLVCATPMTSAAGAVLFHGTPVVGETNIPGAREVVGEDGAVEFATDTLASGIVAVARSGDGFVFLDAAGELWRAASFLGALEHVGNVGLADITPARSSPGRLAVLSAAELFTTDGALPLVRAALPHGVVVDAGFSDTAHGAAILEGGAVAVTGDGGESWRALDLGAPASAITTAGDRVGILREPTIDEQAAGAGERLVLLDDTGAPGEPSAVPEGGTGVGRVRDEAARQAELLALVRAFPAYGVETEYVLTRLVDGRVLHVDGAGLERVDVAHGTSEAIPRSLTGSCLLARWGPFVAARCDETMDGATLYRSADGRAFERVSAFAPSAHVTLSSDGSTAAWPGPCSASTPSSTGGVCVVRAATHFTPEPHAVSAETIGAPAGDWLLVATSDGGLRLLELGTGTLTTPGLPAGRRLRSATLAVDGSLLAVIAAGADGSEASTLFVGSPGGALDVEHPLPSGVRAVGFVDAQRGIAVGANPSTLARTFDGGATWAALPAPVVGDPSRVPLVYGDEVISPVACDALGCWIGSSMVVAVLGWGADVEARVAYLVDADPPPSIADVSSTEAIQITCEAMGPVVPAAVSWRGRVASDANVLVDDVDGVLVRALRWASTDGPRMRIEWQGRDARGAFTGASVDTAIEGSAPDPRRTLMILGASRFGVDVALSNPSHHWNRFHAADGVAITGLPGRLAEGRDPGTFVRGTLGDGGEVLLIEDADDVATLLGVARDGELTSIARRVLPGDSRRIGLAREGDVLRIVVERQRLPGFVLLPLEAGALPRLLAEAATLAVCDDAAAPGAITATMAPGPRFDEGDAPLSRIRTMTLELTDTTACVRAMDVESYGGEGARSARLVASDGDLVGSGGNLEDFREVRCSLTPPASDDGCEDDAGCEADDCADCAEDDEDD